MKASKQSLIARIKQAANETLDVIHLLQNKRGTMTEERKHLIAWHLDHLEKLRGMEEDLRKELKDAAYPSFLDEALNSGDGSYKP